MYSPSAHDNIGHPRRRRLAAGLLAGLVGAAGLATASAHAQPQHHNGVVTLKVAMNGANEVDTVGSPGTATVRLTLDPGGSEVCYSKLRLRNVLVNGETAPSKLHIHAGPPSVNGPVVIDFTDIATTGARKGCMPVEADLVQRIINAPEFYYVNVHTASLPKGAVRGQLNVSRNPKPIKNPTTFDVSINGANEVGVVGSPTGTARITVEVGGGRACFTIREQANVFIREDEFAPSLLHIHRGAAGVNGDVVIDFTDVANFGQRQGCVTTTRALVDEIATNPAGFYVNFHTISFPKGAMRGQLA
jgi:hypothetical protein